VADTETGRVALIRFTAPDGTPCVGSGLLVNGQCVLTADHIAGGSDHVVDCQRRTHEVAQVLRTRSPTLDLAILTLKRPIAGVNPLGCARIDRKLITEIKHCVAVGFPRWKRDGHVRGSAQVNGTIPTGEGLVQTADAGLREGFLTLVGNRQPAAPPIRPGPVTEAGTSSPWGGMSGGVVTAEGAVIGVVRSVNLAAGGYSLTVTPVTGLEHLPDRKLARRFWDALKIPDPVDLPLLPTSQEVETARASAMARRNTLAVASAAFGAGTLLSEFLGRHPAVGHAQADGRGHENHPRAGGSEASHGEHSGATWTHPGPHNDESLHQETHSPDGLHDDPCFHDYC